MKTKPRLLPLLSILFVALGACRGDGDTGAESEPEIVTGQVAGLPIEGLGYATGLESAPVTVIEFSDFGCPYCAQFALDTYPELHTEFVLSGSVRWIFVPFVIGRFVNGEGAALAGECAGEQGRFWQMHDRLFEHQGEWRREGPPDELFLQLAESVGLDVPRFEQCYRENPHAERIERHNQLARQAQVRGTPSFLVNGRQVEGALPQDQFRSLLDYAVLTAE